MNAIPNSSSASLQPRQVQRLVWEITANVVLALFFFRFAWANGQEFFVSFRLSTFLLLTKVSTDVLFYLVRRPPREVSISPYDWTVALMGTYAVAWFLPTLGGHDSVVGQIVQCAGIGLQIYAMLSLNRSIGVVAANRGIKTGGMYRFVRHPLYLSYVVAFGGYLINHCSYYNAAVYSAAVLLWILRIMAEERLLMNDEGYRQYADRVKWRLIPFVF